jgi:hypothetical protein
LSCQSDPIIFNPPGGYEYKTKSFPLINDNSETVQGELHTGTSPRLYSGILSNRDTVSTLIRLSPEVLDSHQVCGSDSIINVDILLTTIIPIAVKENTTIIDTLIQFNALKTYLISSDDFGEDVVISEEILNNIMGSTMNATPLNVELNTNSLELNLLAYENTIIKKWCEDKEDLGIVISYIPTDSSYLEFFSSNDSEVGLGPRLSLEYTIEEETSKNYFRYLINQVSWSDEQIEAMNSGPYYVDDSLSGYWGTFYALSLDLGNQIITDPPLVYDSITVQTDIISAGQNSPLVTIKLDLNPEIINDIDSISFSILNAFAFISDLDPAGDNWNAETNPDSTEGDSTYNVGEIFNDYGVDNCPDELETGDENNPCDSTLSIYSSAGTEGNSQLDWTDENDNGVWDVDEGEEWFDWGTDGCSDNFEVGGDSCATDENLELVTGSDLNGDNFIIDPVGDDWKSETNVDSTENNGKYDGGEPFKDWGTDGLPVSLTGDLDENGTEGNGSYELGEPFDDTGSDGVFNENESGYNADGTEGNNVFDGDGEFSDCGEDNFCNDTEGDDDTDNYNIDPNGDNWNDCGSDGICPSADDYLFEDSDGTEGNDVWDENEGTKGNGQLDWEDLNSNGLWNKGEGEEWFDWGLDGIQDSLEAFQVASVISIERYDNSYIFNLDDELLQSTPDLETDTVNLWISEIQKINNSLKIEVSVQSNKALKGLQFQLYHTPFTKVDSTLETYTPSIAQIGEDKLFEDFTLLPKKNYPDEELNEQLLIEYSNDLSTFLDFDSLNLFLKNEEYIFSHQYSNLVFYIDTTTTDIHENGMWVHLTYEDDSGEDKILFSKKVTSSSDSVEIAMGQNLRAYQSGSITSYNGLKLKTDGKLYNYSKLSIKNNPRIDVMYSQ